MIPKICDIRVSRNGEIVDALCVNSGDLNMVASVLNLAEPNDEVLLIVKDPISVSLKK